MHGDILDVCVHPDQRSVVVTGDSEGVVRVWDIRHPTYPMSITVAHEAPVWAIRFHPRNPDVLFTSGEVCWQCSVVCVCVRSLCGWVRVQLVCVCVFGCIVGGWVCS